MKQIMLFTGHMIDRVDRIVPRFPEKNAARVKEIIKEKLLGLKKDSGKAMSLKGLAGGACGGDILFHEACLELDIPSEMMLSDTVENFKKESVGYAGPEWLERFDHLYMKLPHVVLHKSAVKDNLSRQSDHTDKWSVTNQKMLADAILEADGNVVLIALWDGASGDGPGGTAHMIELVKDKGLGVIIIPLDTVQKRGETGPKAEGTKEG